jgi:poly-gamma-glutamate synthesis protein (capsule biosynthesis protein)
MEAEEVSHGELAANPMTDASPTHPSIRLAGQGSRCGAAQVRLARRAFLKLSTVGPLALLAAPASSTESSSKRLETRRAGRCQLVTLCLCGDVMTGRGVDQVLPHPSDPAIHESHMRSALGYVELAERANGPIPRPVDFSYVWGDALEELERAAPDLRIVNLETSVTRSDDRMPKGINYRMHPENVPCLVAAGIDCCALANNHVLDWGYGGLTETLEVLRKAGLRPVGAGRNAAEAEAPAIIEIRARRRIVVFSLGSLTSGIPPDWAASEDEAGVNLLEGTTIDRIAEGVRRVRKTGDIVVASIHWGGNWGYQIPEEQRSTAHRLIDETDIDVIHGHSSHHPRGIEVYRGRPILYGCGDFLNDYEGIGGYERFRGELVSMYLVTMDPSTRTLARLETIPFRVERFRLHRASPEDARWLGEALDRESAKLGTSLTMGTYDRPTPSPPSG